MSSPLIKSTERFESSSNVDDKEHYSHKLGVLYDKLQAFVDSTDERMRRLDSIAESLNMINTSSIAEDLAENINKSIHEARKKSKFKPVISGPCDYVQVLLLILCLSYIPIILLFWR